MAVDSLFVATEVVDGRKGPDSLMTLVRDVLGHDIFEGHLFVFFTRRRDRVRIVYWYPYGEPRS